MLKNICYVACIAIISNNAVLADTGKIKNPDNDHYYQRFDKTRGWHAAKNYCDQLGGYLATITSETEQEFIWSKFGELNQLDGIWLGGSDERQEGQWNWLTDEIWDYSNWEKNPGTSPDNGGSYGQHYLMLYTGDSWSPQSLIGFWGDMSSLSTFAGAGNNSSHAVSTLCEWDTMPDVYGQISMEQKGAKTTVILKQENLPDKKYKTGIDGKYQMIRKNKKIPATIEISLPASR